MKPCPVCGITIDQKADTCVRDKCRDYFSGYRLGSADQQRNSEAETVARIVAWLRESGMGDLMYEAANQIERGDWKR